MTLDEEIHARAELVCEAFSWIGTPYRHQASTKGQGADCLGLLRGLWRFLFDAEPQHIPPYTPDWIEKRGDEPLLAAAQTYLMLKEAKQLLPADVLLFRMAPRGPVKHCGIYVGEGRFVHAYAGHAVIASSYSDWWRARLVGVYAFPHFSKKGVS